MNDERRRDPSLEWLDHVKPTGLVLSPAVIATFGLVPELQTRVDNDEVAEHLSDESGDAPAIPDPMRFFTRVLGWEERFVTPAADLPDKLSVAIPEHETTLRPDFAVKGFDDDAPWQLLVKLELGFDPDKRGQGDGWEASAHQRFERLLRESGVEAGVMVTGHELRLVYAPKGETSGWLSFPLRALATVAGRAMLGGLKLLLGHARLFRESGDTRLKALFAHSREAQAEVSTRLAEQVLGALHELLRGFMEAEPERIRKLAGKDPQHLYEGLLAVLLRLVFVLYAEDRDLLPSSTETGSRALYDENYSVRGLYGRLVEDAALNPDTMGERFGGWGRLIALFRLIHGGHRSGFVIARRGKLFDPDVFSFLENRAAASEPPTIAKITDGCLLRILEGLMTIVEPATKSRERLSYRTLDVEQIGSVYEIVMGFTVETASGRTLAIKAGKNNKTPVFVDLDALLATKPSDRKKFLKESCDRATIGTVLERELKKAATTDDVASALEGIVDERGSPGSVVIGAGTPVLQPTEERRRTGSHYTPRSLTEPIVRKALRPTLDRLGDDAPPEAILDLKVCDPAMGSGAFLVEACRQLATRLVAAWDRHRGTRPALAADEDADLLARRMVAQRCLYGVDRNPMAVDLARVSLWLATLARDHEFTFLDHALKCGDSLVGLDRAQIEAVHWERTDYLSTLTSGLVREALAKIERERGLIRDALDDASEVDLRPHLDNAVEATWRPRLIGDAVVAAFFAGHNKRARFEERADIVEAIETGGSGWHERVLAKTVGFTLSPFHWQLEFPEVFDRDNGGFDAIVGNPPFAGKNTIIAGNPEGYVDWLKAIHNGAHGNADLVAHFFRRAFDLLRNDGALGLIATNTIRQGDTRATGLAPIRKAGGTIFDAQRRIKWPGEAAVVVATVHICKGALGGFHKLDARSVRRITAFLFHAGGDDDPEPLQVNANKSFVGSYVLGMGFTFDDRNIDKGSTPIAEMHRLTAADPWNAERIFPYIGGEEVNDSPCQKHKRYAIDFFDMPRNRDAEFVGSWATASPPERRAMLQIGSVPSDYPSPVAADWPDLLAIIDSKVKPSRLNQKRKALRERWWQYAEKRPGLYSAIRPLRRVMACSRIGNSFSFVFLSTGIIFNEKVIAFPFETYEIFSIMQSRIHEIWARFFSTTLKDDLQYTPSDCFETFPFPEQLVNGSELEELGNFYYQFRAELMIETDKGLTKTYNDFHKRSVTNPKIKELRALHHAMDQGVLRAYGWDDLADEASPIFLDETNEADFTYQGRLFWPSEFRDEVLARLLALNKERHAEEVRQGTARSTSRGRRAQPVQEELL